jgi:3-oxosteroid 1-dehydrogenase
MATEGFEHEVDVLVVGSGAGGMTAALTARSEGLDALLIEKSEVYGGSSAYSGGGAWIPNHPVLVRQGQRDDPEQILAYLDAIAGDRVSRDRLERYVHEAPRMAELLERQSPAWLRDAFEWVRGYSDYHPDRGGNPEGRGLWPKPIDLRKLGEDKALLRPAYMERVGTPKGAWMTSKDLHDMVRLRWGGWRGRKVLLKLSWRTLRFRVLGERIGASGQALIARLRLALKDAGCRSGSRRRSGRSSPTTTAASSAPRSSATGARCASARGSA